MIMGLPDMTYLSIAFHCPLPLSGVPGLRPLLSRVWFREVSELYISQIRVSSTGGEDPHEDESGVDIDSLIDSAVSGSAASGEDSEERALEVL